MSCNGCRVLRKGCSDTCILRPCLQWIHTPEAQGHATVFVAKFFGRAGLMSFLSAVPQNQRPAVFQSLLFEAAGRTVNPVNGAVGLLWTGNWHICQTAVETVLHGGSIKPIPDLVQPDTSDASDCTDMFKLPDQAFPCQKRRRFPEDPAKVVQLADLDLSLSPGMVMMKGLNETRRLGSPSMTSEESLTTTCGDHHQPSPDQIKLLNLFN